LFVATMLTLSKRPTMTVYRGPWKFA
jgi:hypothetical protein